MTSWTVLIFSASSSDISISYSSSSAITNSTISSESAPKSSMNEASGVTSSSLTPSCSQTISFTLASTDDAIVFTSYLTFSSHQESAIYVDHLSRDVAGARPDEEGNRLSDILAGAEAARRYGMQELLLKFLGKPGRHLRLNVSRRHRVHRDAARGQLPRHRLGKADHAGFRSRVSRLSCVPCLPHHRRHVDDPAVPLADHASADRLGTVDGSFEVDAENSIPILALQADQQIVG